jgi:hypothetical protein
VSETEFDRYAADYRATVNEAAGIAGADLDRLAGHKARCCSAWWSSAWATRAPARSWTSDEEP